MSSSRWRMTKINIDKFKSARARAVGWLSERRLVCAECWWCLWNVLSMVGKSKSVSLSRVWIDDFSHLNRLPRGRFHVKSQINIVECEKWQNRKASAVVVVKQAREKRTQRKETAAWQRWNSHNLMIIVIYDESFVSSHMCVHVQVLPPCSVLRSLSEHVVDDRFIYSIRYNAVERWWSRNGKKKKIKKRREREKTAEWEKRRWKQVFLQHRARALQLLPA